MAEETGTAPTLQFKRVEDFVSLYANNVQIEQTAFDLKLVFGELVQSQRPALVEQHSSVTLSWPETKLLSYYLQLNIASYEIQMGKIKIREDLIPIALPQLSPEQEKDPKIQELFAVAKRLHEQFIASL